jgi:hypothetical protein
MSLRLREASHLPVRFTIHGPVPNEPYCNPTDIVLWELHFSRISVYAKYISYNTFIFSVSDATPITDSASTGMCVSKFRTCSDKSEFSEEGLRSLS